MLIAANKSDIHYAEDNIERIKTFGYIVVPCSAEAELVLRKASEKGLIEYKPGDSSFNLKDSVSLTKQQMRALGIIHQKVLKPYKTTGIQEAVNAAFFRLLNMIVIYTVEDAEKLSDHNGRVLPDARLVPKGTTAHQLAFIVHTELGESFIYAIDVRSRMRRGDNYILKNGDVVSIISSKRRS
jgi:ribosome-binding ATPase YchF (GTP1/OBG family)